MPRLATQLTEATGNLVDFYNIGGLAIQRTKNSLWGLWTHYSWRELFIRGGIVTATIMLGVVSANTCTDENCSSATRGLIGAGIGFFAAHTLAVVPTMRRRYQLKADAVELQKQTKEKLSEFAKDYPSHSEYHTQVQNISSRIENFCNYLATLSLPVIKKGDAVTNLAKIKSLSRKTYNELEELQLALKNSDTEEQAQLFQEAELFWNQSNGELFKQLEEHKTSNTAPSRSMQ